MGIDTKLAAEMWNTHAAVLPFLHDADEGEKDGRAEAWQRYAAKLAHARQPFFFADTSTLPADWHDDSILASLPKPAKQAPKIREDRRAKKGAVQPQGAQLAGAKGGGA